MRKPDMMSKKRTPKKTGPSHAQLIRHPARRRPSQPSRPRVPPRYPPRHDRLAILAKGGSVEWEVDWGSIHDVHVLDNGHVMVQRGPSAVVEF